MDNYSKYIEECAIDLLNDLSDNIVESLVGEDDLDDLLESSYVLEQEHSFSLEDACVVARESGLDDNGCGGDLESQFIYSAVSSAENDVRGKLQEHLSQIQQDYDDALNDAEIEIGERYQHTCGKCKTFRDCDNEKLDKCEEDKRTCKDLEEEEDEESPEFEKIAKDVVDEYLKGYDPKEQLSPVPPGSYAEKELLLRWFRMNNSAGMRGGYPLGRSYIDARCGTGLDGDVEYINFDHEVAAKLPHLANKYRDHIRKYFKDTFPDEPIDKYDAEQTMAEYRRILQDIYNTLFQEADGTYNRDKEFNADMCDPLIIAIAGFKKLPVETEVTE